MKKFLAAAFLYLLSTSAFAQTTEGSVVIGGSVGFSTSKSETPSSYFDSNKATFSIMPTVGFLVRDGLEAGLGFGYEYSKVEGMSLDESTFFKNPKEIGLSISPYLKKYINITDNFAFYGAGILSLSAKKFKYENDGASLEIKNKGLSAGLVPGLVFFPTQKVGLSASFGFLGYSLTKSGEGYDSKTSSFGLNLNSSTLDFGFSYFISR